MRVFFQRYTPSLLLAAFLAPMSGGGEANENLAKCRNLGQAFAYYDQQEMEIPIQLGSSLKKKLEQIIAQESGCPPCLSKKFNPVFLTNMTFGKLQWLYALLKKPNRTQGADSEESLGIKRRLPGKNNIRHNTSYCRRALPPLPIGQIRNSPDARKRE